MKDTILVYSGGMDSTVLLHEWHGRIKIALSINYGSKHNEREIERAARNCQKFGIQHNVIYLGFIGDMFSSDLLKSGGEIPYGVYDEQTIRRTVVPFRNAIMLSIATGLAESNNCNIVLIASHSGDHAIYPDCRPEFNSAMAEAIRKGTYAGINLMAPYSMLSKRDIANRGKMFNVDFADTYSCYRGGEVHCGECSTCLERKEALKGFDPTEYLV